MTIRFDSVFGFRPALAIGKKGFGPNEFIRSELKKTILQEVKASERALRADFLRRHSTVGKPGGLSPEEFQAYATDIRNRFRQLGEVRRLAGEPGLTSAQLYDLRGKLRNVGKPGGLSPEEFPAYLQDMKYRARHRIPGGPGAPYPARLQHLVSSVNAIQDIAESRQNLIRDEKAKAANVGRAGAMSPEEYQAYSADIQKRHEQLDALEDLVKRYELPKELIDDVRAKVRHVGRAGGMVPEEFDAYLLDIAYRAKYRVPGGPSSPYPADRAHVVPAINAMEAVSAARQDLIRDMKAKAANVGRAGAMSPEEYQAYFLDMSTRMHILDGAANLLKQVELPATVARDLQAKLRHVGRAGGMSPEEFAAYLADVRTKAIGPGPLAGGFSHVR